MPSVSQNMEDIHRYLLQSFMSRGILGNADVKELQSNACRRFDEADEGPMQLAGFVRLINEHIRQLDLEIKKALSEENGSSFYVLVNTLDSPVTKFAQEYEPHEFEFFKALVSSIIESDTGSIRSTEALNLVHQIRKLDKSQAEELLGRLHLQKWIISDKGWVSLHTRSVVELEQYIRDTFPNLVVNCEVCKKICIKGQSCTECDVKMHAHCAGRLGATSCPNKACSAPWSHELPRRRKGDTSFTEEQQPSTSKRSK